MAIEVNFYKNFNKRSNSTLVPGASVEKSVFLCTLKNNCSIIDPVFDILKVVNNPAQEGYNYAYIPSFKRYYFINDFSWNSGVWSCSMSCDTLASFKTEIGDLYKYITRSAQDFNGYQIDSKYPALANANISYLKGDNPFKSGTGSYIVGVVGQNQTNVPNVGGINYYLFTYSQMIEFINYLTSSTFASAIKDDGAGLTEGIVKAVVNPTDYIMSCMWFPFEIVSAISGYVQPKIGWWDVSPISGDGLKPLGFGLGGLSFSPSNFDNEITLTDHPQISRGLYLNCSPYSKYTFHLEPWGDIDIDGASILNVDKISYSIQCEGISGMGALEIYAGGKLITRRIAQVGVPVSIAQIINSLGDIGTGDILKGATVGAVQAIKKFDIKNAFKNVMSAMTGHKTDWSTEIDIGSDILSGIEASNADIDIRGINGSYISYIGTYLANSDMYTQGSYIKVIRYNLIDEAREEAGRPLNAYRKINTLAGFIQCADSDINISCLADEKNSIQNYLTGGFYYE